MRCTDPLEKNLDTLFLLYHSITEDEIEYTYLCILFFVLNFFLTIYFTCSISLLYYLYFII